MYFDPSKFATFEKRNTPTRVRRVHQDELHAISIGEQAMV
jgi:hypothetical protein